MGQRFAASRSAVARAVSGLSPLLAVVHLDALKTPRYDANPVTLNKVVAAAFNQRRKMLRSSLKGLAIDIEDRLASAGITPTERAEQLSLEQFCALARALDTD